MCNQPNTVIESSIIKQRSQAVINQINSGTNIDNNSNNYKINWWIYGAAISRYYCSITIIAIIS